MNDNEFAHDLRARAAAVTPAVAVDTSGIVRDARRHRMVRRGASGIVALALVAGTGWTAYARPWESPSGDGAALPAAQSSDAASNGLSTQSEQGKYWYVKTQSQVYGADGKPDAAPATNETWIGNDTPGIVIPNGDTSKVSEFGPAHWGELTVNGKDTLLTWSALATLPTDPAALEKVLRDSTHVSSDDPTNPTPDMQVLTFAQSLLEDSPASPALRNAVWTVITQQPSASKTSPTTDALGRPGTAVTTEEGEGDGSLTWTFVFDEKTNTLLEERVADKATGRLMGTTTYVEQHASDTIPIQPDPNNSGGCGVSWERC